MKTQIPDHFFEELFLRVARRADELARLSARPTLLNRECWLIAEAEILQLVPYFAPYPESEAPGIVAFAGITATGPRFAM